MPAQRRLVGLYRFQHRNGPWPWTRRSMVAPVGGKRLSLFHYRPRTFRARARRSAFLRRDRRSSQRLAPYGSHTLSINPVADVVSGRVIPDVSRGRSIYVGLSQFQRRLLRDGALVVIDPLFA